MPAPSVAGLTPIAATAELGSASPMPTAQSTRMAMMTTRLAPNSSVQTSRPAAPASMQITPRSIRGIRPIRPPILAETSAPTRKPALPSAIRKP